MLWHGVFVDIKFIKCNALSLITLSQFRGGMEARSSLLLFRSLPFLYSHLCNTQNYFLTIGKRLSLLFEELVLYLSLSLVYVYLYVVCIYRQRHIYYPWYIAAPVAQPSRLSLILSLVSFWDEHQDWQPLFMNLPTSLLKTWGLWPLHFLLAYFYFQPQHIHFHAVLN